MAEFIASNAYRRLNELSVGSVKINAAVCHWTMPPGELAPAFISALRHEDSSLVVDIHSPASIDSLAKLNLAGVHVFLYLFQIVGKTEVADSKGIPDHLMHAKIFVFDYGTSEIRIWVGSHNGTRRALLGLNFEFATVVSCERDSGLHLKALRFIGEIRNISVVFEQSETDLYRTIQGGLQIDAFIELQEPKVWASKHGALPAIPVEELVTQQIVAVLSAPHMVQAVWDRIRETRPELSEPEVVLPMRNLAGLWRQLFPVEQWRLAKLLIERVVMADGGLEILWRDHGWQELTRDLLPGTISAELQEIETAA